MQREATISLALATNLNLPPVSVCSKEQLWAGFGCGQEAPIRIQLPATNTTQLALEAPEAATD